MDLNYELWTWNLHILLHGKMFHYSVGQCDCCSVDVVLLHICSRLVSLVYHFLLKIIAVSQEYFPETKGCGLTTHDDDRQVTELTL